MADPEDELVASLRARLQGDPVEHERFVGPPVDILGLSPLGLGRLLAAMRTAWQREGYPAGAALISSIRRQVAAAGIVPALDDASSLEVFQGIESRQWPVAIEHLDYLVGKPSPALQTELRRILGDPAIWIWRDKSLFDPFKALALFRWGNGTEEQLHALNDLVRERWAGSPLQLGEFEVLQRIGPAALLALARTHGGHYLKGEADEGKDPAVHLADEAAYVSFAQETLEAAARRVGDIRSGRLKYEADTAFTPDDAQVIARSVRVAAYRDDPWLGPLIRSLLPGVSVAPTAAKTVPSQALAIALGHAIGAIPTPEGVLALREALGAVRHAGIEKKLARHLKPAERGLAARPELALRLAATAKPDKKQRAMLATCLESTFWQGFDLALREWRTRLAETSNGQPFARGLVWTAMVADAAPIHFMPDPKQPRLAFVDVTGRPVALPEACRIGLWHPLCVDADERRAWQAKLASLRIVQPLRQVFREHYQPTPEERASDALQTFAGHELSIRPLLGLARREGWQLDRQTGLSRRFGNVRATFVVGAELYPGAQGHAQSLALHFELHRGRGWCRVPIDELDPVVVSEACRAVDLLVSVAGFAVEDGTGEMPLTAGDLGLHFDGQPCNEAPAVSHPRVRRRRRLDHLAEKPLGEMARMRREALRLALAGPIAEGRATVGDRHVYVGNFAVHLATARVTDNGAAVELELPTARAKLAALPWLPYDEVLLQRIADAVGALLEKGVVDL